MNALPIELLKAIEARAEKLANFTLNYKLLGNVESINRLQAWCGNFLPFLPDMEVLVPVINNIRFVPDMEIIDRVMHSIEEEFPGHESSVFLCPFGGENESSARIIKNLNHHHGYSGSLEGCLKRIKGRNVENSIIVFIDDCLNSGGQFSSILETWMTKDSAKPDFRKALPEELQNLLRQCHLRFYFYLGMHPGRERAEAAIKKHRLNARAVIFQQYDDKRGIFGNPASIAEIRAGLAKPACDSSIFSGFTCRQVQPFLELCEQAGLNYLKRTKPEWPKEKTAGRILGYGNSAQLFVNANNVPTSTLTCLWAEGPMQISNHDIYWQPLLPRRQKLAGNESVSSKANIEITDAQCRLPVTDDTEGKDSAFEVMLFSHFPQMSRESISLIPARDRFHLFTNAFMPLIRNKFRASQNGFPEISFFNVDNEALAAYNDRPQISLLNETYLIKEIRASLSTIGNYCFAAIRIKFSGSRINLDKCLGLINKISQNNRPGNTSAILSTARGNFTIPELFEKIFRLPGGGVSEYPRFKIMTFIRLAAESMPETKSLDSFLPPFKLFKPGYFNRKNLTHDAPLHVKLDGGSILTLSEEGAAALCLSDNPAGGSYIQWLFMTQCYFLYLTGYASLINGQTEPEESAANNLLIQELKRSHCVREYLDVFLRLSYKTFCRKNQG